MITTHKFFAFCDRLFQAQAMTKPLALVLYEKMLPGSQLVNKLQDLNYRVDTIADAGALVEIVQQKKPLLALVDLASSLSNVSAAIARLKQTSDTKHLPVIAFAGEHETELQEAARKAGATLVVNEVAMITHLPQFLEQALHVE
jgi:CheY-like chemotaxis protein